MNAALREDEARAAGILARIPAARWATPDDFKGTVVYLASRASGYVSGEVVSVHWSFVLLLGFVGEWLMWNRLQLMVAGWDGEARISLGPRPLCPYGILPQWSTESGIVVSSVGHCHVIGGSWHLLMIPSRARAAYDVAFMMDHESHPTTYISPAATCAPNIQARDAALLTTEMLLWLDESRHANIDTGGADPPLDLPFDALRATTCSHVAPQTPPSRQVPYSPSTAYQLFPPTPTHLPQQSNTITPSTKSLLVNLDM